MKSKLKQIKRFQIPDMIFNPLIYVVAGGSCSAAGKWFQKKINAKTSPELVNRIACVMVHDDYYACCLWFDSVRPGAACVAHEVMHATAYILRHCDTPLTFDTEDVYAAYNAFLTKMIGAKLWWHGH